MSDFFSVLSLSSSIDTDDIHRIAKHSCLDIHRVQWLRSYLSRDRTQMLCWYRALDGESVRLALHQQDAIGVAVRPALVDSPDEQTPPHEGECLAAVFHLQDLAPDELASIRTVMVQAIEGAGLALSRTFVSTNSGELALLIKDCDESALLRCLQPLGIEPLSLWQCEEIDPRSPALFETMMPTEEATARIEDFQSGKPEHAEGGHRHPSTETVEKIDAVIIGAGVAGICALRRFLTMGISVQVCESGSEIGGVWHWNRYPGARVDSETYTYGFSFSDELLQNWEWRELFAPQADIHRYLLHVVERFDLRRHIRLDTTIAAASYDEGSGRWLIDTESGDRIAARYLVAATGALSTPQLPDYPGMDMFAGESYHTARWPSSGVSLRGKRVGVVGTGASGVQVIQTIAAEVAQLTVFQRTPTYCTPLRNRVLNRKDQQQIRRNWTDILAACSNSYGGFIHDFDPRSGLAVTAREREEKFEALWQQSGFAFWFSNFADLMMNREVNEHASEFVRKQIRARVDDAEVAKKLLPDHPFGSKRVPLEDGFYEVFNRDNVKLVDLRETAIDRITADGIHTYGGEYPLDVIVYATGFDAGTGALTRIDIRGQDQVLLSEKWQDGPQTYLGLMVAEFPNLFIVNGPHNAAALCNAVRCIEQNVDWIAGCMEHMRRHKLSRIRPLPAAEQEWTAHVHEAAEASLLGHMKNSWFFGANTPGKSRQVLIYAPGAREYRQHCERVANAGYPGCEMS